MSEGNIWPCKWRKTDAGYEIKVRPIWRTLRVEAPTIDDAVMAMKDKICERHGDGEACLLPDFPFPVVLATKHASVGSHVQFSSNGGTSSLLTSPVEIWHGGVCSECGAACGARTSKTALVYIDGDGDVPMCRTECGPLQVISERLAQQLTPSESARFKFRPVDTYEPTALKYVEIIPINAHESVWPVDVAAQGFSCSTCSSVRISVADQVQQDVSLFVRAEEMADDSVRAVRDWTTFHIVCSLSRWRELREKGVLTETAYDLVGLLSKEHANVPRQFKNIVEPFNFTIEKVAKRQAHTIRLVQRSRELRGKVFERDGQRYSVGEPDWTVTQRVVRTLVRLWRG